MTTDEKIDLLFFDPYKTRDEYINYYKLVASQRYIEEKGRYRYSPIFLLLKDIHFCYGIGKEFNPVRDNLNFPEFAGILLVRIAFTNTIKKFYYGQLEKFAEEFMGISDKEELQALGLLRNALEHSYYSLYLRRKHSPKVYFTLGLSFDHIIKKDSTWQRSYPSEMYTVNPRRLFSGFEKGLFKFKELLLDPCQQKLRKHFDENFDIDQWIATGP